MPWALTPVRLFRLLWRGSIGEDSEADSLPHLARARSNRAIHAPCRMGLAYVPPHLRDDPRAFVSAMEQQQQKAPEGK